MTTLYRQILVIVTLALGGCVSALGEREAQLLADEALRKAVGSNSTQEPKTERLRSNRFRQGWQFEYRTWEGDKSAVYAILVNDDKRVEVSRQGPD